MSGPLDLRQMGFFSMAEGQKESAGSESYTQTHFVVNYMNISIRLEIVGILESGAASRGGLHSLG